MGSTKVSAPPAPAAPQAIDAGQAIRSYMQGISDPALQQQILNAEASYRPQYTALNQRDIQNTLLGVAPGTAEGFYGTLDLQAMVAQRQAELNQGLLNQQRQFEIGQLGTFGPQATQAYLAANPGLADAVSQAQGLSSSSNIPGLDKMGAFLGSQPQAQNISAQQVGVSPINVGGTLTADQVKAQQVAAERVAAQQVGTSNANAGALGNSLYQQALQAQQFSPLSQALQGQALGMATNPGAITAQESRAAAQGVRETMADRGRLNDNVTVANEALARGALARDRTYQDLAAAQGINSQLLGAQQMGQQLATDVLKTDLQRQQFNISNQLGASQFNADSALRAALANQGTGLQASLANQSADLQSQLANQQANMAANQFNISNSQDVARQNAGLSMQAQLANQQANIGVADSNRAFNAQQQQQYFNNLQNYGLLGAQNLQQDRSYALNLAGLQSGISANSLGLLGAPAAAMNYGLQQQGIGMQQAGITGPSLFDPNAGLNLALQNNANQANYNASIYGSNAALAGANAQARASQNAGLAQGAATIGAAALLFACRVAREVYGEESGDWRVFRVWLLTNGSPRRIYRYIKNGGRIAEWLRSRPEYKARVKRWMDGKIAEQRAFWQKGAVI